MLPFLPKKMAEEQENEDELIKELIPWYLASEKENLVLLEKALAQSDFPVLIEIGDKLYGHGKSFGFGHISILGKRIEIAAIQQDLAMLKDLVFAFKEYLQECCKQYNVN